MCRKCVSLVGLDHHECVYRLLGSEVAVRVGERLSSETMVETRILVLEVLESRPRSEGCRYHDSSSYVVILLPSTVSSTPPER